MAVYAKVLKYKAAAIAVAVFALVGVEAVSASTGDSVWIKKISGTDTSIYNRHAGGTGGKVSIATSNIAGANCKLMVNGGAAIGYSTAALNPSKTNSLMVSGSIGIGTTSPTARMHVTGRVLADSLHLYGATPYFMLRNIPPVGTAYSMVTLVPDQLFMYNTGSARQTTVASGNILVNGGYNNRTTRISSDTITATTNTGAQTVISGDFVKTGTVYVGTAGWAIKAPDYVFHKDYSLMPLSKVEKFVKQNGHLPEVPSAREMEQKQSVDLVQMNMLLLKKVEELTLHSIAQEKRIGELEKKIGE